MSEKSGSLNLDSSSQRVHAAWRSTVSSLNLCIRAINTMRKLGHAPKDEDRFLKRCAVYTAHVANMKTRIRIAIDSGDAEYAEPIAKGAEQWASLASSVADRATSFSNEVKKKYASSNYTYTVDGEEEIREEATAFFVKELEEIRAAEQALVNAENNSLVAQPLASSAQVATMEGAHSLGAAVEAQPIINPLLPRRHSPEELATSRARGEAFRAGIKEKSRLALEAGKAAWKAIDDQPHQMQVTRAINVAEEANKSANQANNWAKTATASLIKVKGTPMNTTNPQLRQRFLRLLEMVEHHEHYAKISAGEAVEHAAKAAACVNTAKGEEGPPSGHPAYPESAWPPYQSKASEAAWHAEGYMKMAKTSEDSAKDFAMRIEKEFREFMEDEGNKWLISHPEEIVKKGHWNRGGYLAKKTRNRKQNKKIRYLKKHHNRQSVKKRHTIRIS